LIVETHKLLDERQNEFEVFPLERTSKIVEDLLTPPPHFE